jgi:glycosyltransferase involved in cell wall biosynthesis
MAMAKHVVAARSGGVPEIVEEGVTGIHRKAYRNGWENGWNISATS